MMRDVKTVVVHGSGPALWLAANVLFAALGDALKVIAVDAAAGEDGRVCASLPPLRGLHQRVGIDEHNLLRACGGTYSLGLQFEGLAGAGSRMFLPTGGFGPRIEGVDFVNYFVRARQNGLPVAFEDFSLTAAAARQGRFFVPTEEMAGYALCDYGYHLPAVRYAAVLKHLAETSGVTVIPGRVTEAIGDEGGEVIRALRLEDGQTVDGDLFIDCGGPGGTLSADAGDDFESWRAWFPFDRILRTAAPGLKRIPAMGHVRALPHGLLHTFPLQAETLFEYAFDSTAMDDAAAATAALRAAGLPPETPWQVEPLHPGRCRIGWQGNRLAIGPAFAAFDPLHRLDLHMTQLALVILLALFPRKVEAPGAALEFNRRVTMGADRMRDFQIAHLKLNTVPDGPAWRRMREMEAPLAVVDKIELFRSRADVAMLFDETFLQEGWAALFLGMGVLPRSYSPFAAALPDAALIAEIKSRLAFLSAQVGEMDSHDAYIEMHCASYS